MAVLDYALTDLATMKDFLNIPLANTSVDTKLERFIDAATEKIENYTSRMLKKRTAPTKTEYHDGRGNDRLLLDQWPAEKPTELWVDSTGEFTDPLTLVDPEDYELELSAKGDGIGVVLLGHCGRSFSRGTRNIKIVYDHGYDPVPADLENACHWTVEFFYNMREKERVGLESKGKNQETTRYQGDLPPIVMDILDRYRRCEWALGTVPVANR